MTEDNDSYHGENNFERQAYINTHTFSIPKGTAAALCFHAGSANANVVSQFYEKFAKESNDDKKLNAILAYMGAAFFEKCSRADKAIADLHKINSQIIFACGMSKLSPDVSKGPIKGYPDLKYPQVDMTWFVQPLTPDSSSTQWHQERYLASQQYQDLITVDMSSNEHQILREIFNDPYAISTVKLLQLAEKNHQMNNLSGAGFLQLSPTTFSAIDKAPDLAQFQYFPQLKNFDINQIIKISPEHWAAVNSKLTNSSLSNFSYAYMTPGPVSNQDGSSSTMGTLILGPNGTAALISSSNLLYNGGFGSSLANSLLSTKPISEWSLVPNYSSYSLAINSFASSVPKQDPGQSLIQPDLHSKRYDFTFNPSPQFSTAPEVTKLQPDTRLGFKPIWNAVADPVDVVTGAFYVDEVDLTLPGSFPLTIRRNYNSQNPIQSIFGCGWKLSLNPFLVEQEGKLYAAEADGTVIVYRPNSDGTRWIVTPEDNPDLTNGRGNLTNPFQAYIENNILYSSNGSERVFENGLLQTWTNASGTALTFLYDQQQLTRIESSTGAYCGFHYTPEGRISEIYSQDGRRINYTYDSQGDIRTVTLPNGADSASMNTTDSIRLFARQNHMEGCWRIVITDGKVTQQFSPMGQNQTMIETATFEYQDGFSKVTRLRRRHHNLSHPMRNRFTRSSIQKDTKHSTPGLSTINHGLIQNLSKLFLTIFPVDILEA